MKVITAEPLDMIEMINLTGKDAGYTINNNKVCIMAWSPNQEIEVDKIEYDAKINKYWGLRKVKSDKRKSFDYLAGIIRN